MRLLITMARPIGRLANWLNGTSPRFAPDGGGRRLSPVDYRLVQGPMVH